MTSRCFILSVCVCVNATHVQNWIILTVCIWPDREPMSVHVRQRLFRGWMFMRIWQLGAEITGKCSSLHPVVKQIYCLMSSSLRYKLTRGGGWCLLMCEENVPTLKKWRCSSLKTKELTRFVFAGFLSQNTTPLSPWYLAFHYDR